MASSFEWNFFYTLQSAFRLDCAHPLRFGPPDDAQPLIQHRTAIADRIYLADFPVFVLPRGCVTVC
jgi:hypothetical protein